MMITSILVAAFAAVVTASTECCYEKTLTSAGDISNTENWEGGSSDTGCDSATLEGAATVSTESSLSSLTFTETGSIEFQEGSSLSFVNDEGTTVCQGDEKTPEEVETYAAEYAADTMCSFKLCITLIQPTYAQVFDTCVELDEDQLAGTKKANLALSMVDATMDITARMTSCDTNRTFTTETQFTYSTTAGTQVLNLIMIENNTLSYGLSNAATAFAPILTSFTAPLSVNAYGQPVDFTAAALSMKSDVVNFNFSFTAANPDITSINIPEVVVDTSIVENADTSTFSGTASVTFSETYFDAYLGDNGLFPLALRSSANATDADGLTSNSIASDFLIDISDELIVESYILKAPNLVKATIEAGSTPEIDYAKLGEDSGVTFSLEVSDADFTDSIVPDYVEELTCTVSATSSTSTPGGCNRPDGDCNYVGCDTSDVTFEAPTGVNDITYKFTYEWKPSYDATLAYGVSLCRFEVKCEDYTAQINLPDGIAPGGDDENQTTGVAVFVLQAAPAFSIDPDVSDIPIVTRDLIAGSTVAGDDVIQAKIEVVIRTTNMPGNVEFGYLGSREANTFTGYQAIDATTTMNQLVADGPVYGVHDDDASSTNVHVFSAVFNFSKAQMGNSIGTFIVDVKFEVNGVTYAKSLNSKLRVEQDRRDRRDIVAGYAISRETRQQKVLPIAPLKLKIEGDQMIIDLGFGDVTITNGTEVEIVAVPEDTDLSNVTTASPEAQEEEEQLSGKTEIWVLAVIATGALLLVAFVIVLVIIMKRDNGRRSAKVMPFWAEGAVPHYTPKVGSAGDVKAMEAGKIDATSF